MVNFLKKIFLNEMCQHDWHIHEVFFDKNKSSAIAHLYCNRCEIKEKVTWNHWNVIRRRQEKNNDKKQGGRNHLGA